MRRASAYVLFAVLTIAVSSYFAFRPHGAGPLAFLIAVTGPTIALGIGAAFWARREEFLSEWLTPKWGDFTRGVVGGVLLFGIVWAAARWTAPVGSPREIWLVSLYGQFGDPRVLQAHGPAVAATIAAVALAEEVLWRGMVTQVLAERVGSHAAWVWAAGLYALVYAPTAWALRAEGGSLNPVLIVAALGAGLLWGGMARAFGRLAPGVLAHALFDWAVVMMFPLWGLNSR